jgi:hypothetical protein
VIVVGLNAKTTTPAEDRLPTEPVRVGKADTTILHDARESDSPDLDQCVVKARDVCEDRAVLRQVGHPEREY